MKIKQQLLVVFGIFATMFVLLMLPSCFHSKITTFGTNLKIAYHHDWSKWSLGSATMGGGYKQTARCEECGIIKIRTISERVEACLYKLEADYEVKIRPITK